MPCFYICKNDHVINFVIPKRTKLNDDIDMTTVTVTTPSKKQLRSILFYPITILSVFNLCYVYGLL